MLMYTSVAPFRSEQVPSITTNRTYKDGWVNYRLDLKDTQSYLYGEYDVERGEPEIGMVSVEPACRGQGLGKELLKGARREAQTLGASTITATIISRECLDAVRGVFGEGAVLVREVGSYGRSNTEAFLHYSLEPASALQ
jgi:GNAT superfamily N-acetyltransferase